MINIILNELAVEPTTLIELGSDVFNNPSMPNVIDVENYIAVHGPYSTNTIFWYGIDKDNADYIWTMDSNDDVIKLWSKSGNNKTTLSSVDDDLDFNDLPDEPTDIPVVLINNDIVLEKYSNGLLFWTYDNIWVLSWYYETLSLNTTPLALITYTSDSSGIYNFSVSQQYYDGDAFTNADKGIIRVYNAYNGAIIYNSGLVTHDNMFSSTYVTGQMGVSIAVKYDLYLTDISATEMLFLIEYHAVTSQKQIFTSTTMFKATN